MGSVTITCAPSCTVCQGATTDVRGFEGKIVDVEGQNEARERSAPVIIINVLYSRTLIRCSGIMMKVEWDWKMTPQAGNCTMPREIQDFITALYQTQKYRNQKCVGGCGSCND